MKQLVFSNSNMFTLGVELEFQLVDQSSLDLVPCAHAILKRYSRNNDRHISLEFLQSIIEIQTGVCENVLEVATDLAKTIQIVEDIADKEHCFLYSASLHPFAEPTVQEVSSNARYKRIMDELQLVGRQFISQGLHVHVGVGHGDTAIRVCDIIQAYLPVLLAMSTSSPFFCGADTGFSSYRTKLFEALPLAGIAGFIGSWQNYVDEIEYLQRLQIIETPKDLWWDVRPSPGFGTVEIRICDIPSRFSEIMSMTSVIQALVAFIIEKDIAPHPIDLQLLRSNKWQAARHGLQGQFNDVFGVLGTRPQSLKNAGLTLLRFLRPYGEKFASLEHIRAMENVLEAGTSSARQRALVQQGKTFTEMITLLREDYWI